jgi:hypothetical protein
MRRIEMGRVFALMTLVVLLSSTAHAALIERLMGEPGVVKISVHTFFALNNERIHGRQTRQNVIDALGLSGDDITEYDALAALAPSGSTALAEAQKSLFLGSVHSVLLLGESRIVGYDTPALVRAKLGLP